MSIDWIRISYAVLLALIVAATVVLGALMVDVGPRAPDTPGFTFAQLQNGGTSQQDTTQLVNTVDRFYQDAYDYRRAYPSYQRDMFLILVGIAILVGALGVVLPPSINSVRLGFLLAAVLLVAYGSYIALASTPNPAPTNGSSVTNLLAAGSPPGLDFSGRFLRFALAFVGVLVLVFVGLWRLTEWAPIEPIPSAVPDRALVPRSADAGTSVFTSPAPLADSTILNVPAPVPSEPERPGWNRPESG